MTTDKKAATQAARPGAASNTAISAHNSTATDPLRGWFLSISTTAACVVSLAAPLVAALSGLIVGGRL